MDVPTLERTLKLEAQVPDDKRRSVLIEAIHGVGKSEIIRQIAAFLSIFFKCPYQLIDIRLGQRETGDIIGMPRVFTNKVIRVPTFINGQFQYVEETVSEVMGHDMPVWFPRNPKGRGIVLFDEMHNAQKETLQAVQEVTLDHRLNGEPMPPGYMLIAAGNHLQEIYGTTTINPAQYDRFMVIRFKPTLKDWQNHAERINVHGAIVRFISIHGLEALDPPDKMTDSDGEGATRWQSRRSWVALSDRIVEYAALGDDPMKDTDFLFHIGMSLVGRIMASQFQDFVMKDYKAVSAEDILNKMSAEQEGYIKQVLVPEMAWYSRQITKYVNEQKITKLAKGQAANLSKFLFAIPKEGVAMFYDRFIRECRETCTDWLKENKEVKDYCNSVMDMKAALR